MCASARAKSLYRALFRASAKFPTVRDASEATRGAGARGVGGAASCTALDGRDDARKTRER